jgi:hypothetical protein
VPTVSADAAQWWFIAGAIVAMVAGGSHVILALVDTVRPTFFVPIESSAKTVMEGTGGRLVRMFGGSGAKPSIWRVWLGVHITHGLGVFIFGLLCLLIATYDFDLVKRIDVIRPLTIAVSAAYLAVSLRFFFGPFFFGPVVVTASATACFTIAAVLSA